MKNRNQLNWRKSILFFSMALITFLGISVIATSNEAMAQSTFCPRLEGTNLKCLDNTPTPIPVPTGIVCAPSSKSTTCIYYKTAGEISRSAQRSVCTSYSCDIENSPEGLPRYISKCTSQATCCSIESTPCYVGITRGEGQLVTKENCDVELVCPPMDGMNVGSGGIGECPASSGPPPTCDSSCPGEGSSSCGP